MGSNPYKIPSQEMDQETQEQSTGSSYRMSGAELARECSSEVQNILRYELNAALTHFLSKDRSVFLEGFGILFPEIRHYPRSEVRDRGGLMWEETVRTAIFEKCADLVALPTAKFPDLTETRELSQWIHPRLPSYITTRWSEKDVRRLLRGLIDSIKCKVIQTGVCSDLTSIGVFYSIHNRQGASPQEWFAGADIFLLPTEPTVLSTTKKSRFERPVLSDSWELIEAAYGPSAETTNIDLPKVLADLGYDVSLLPADIDPQIPVRIFRRNSERRDRETLIYCTNGLRKLGLSAPNGLGHGSEVVLQLEVSRSWSASTRSLIEPSVRSIVAAWVLMQSSKSRSLRLGAGFSFGTALFPNEVGETPSKKSLNRGILTTIFVTRFNPLSTEQLTPEGPFFYHNLIGITDEEAKFARDHSPERLEILLERRKLTQVTSQIRPSILLRTGFISETEESEQT